MTSTPDITGKQLPLVTACLHESLEVVSSTPWGHACPDLLWQPTKAGKKKKIQECSQVYPIVGGGRNGVAEEN